jgi:hypothetical protein
MELDLLVGAGDTVDCAVSACAEREDFSSA